MTALGTPRPHLKPIAYRNTSGSGVPTRPRQQKQAAPKQAPIPPGIQKQMWEQNPSGQSFLGPASQTPVGPPASAPSYDFSADPVLQQIMAAAARSMQEAQATAIAKQKELAISYGDASGLGLDASTEKAAADNPFSVIKDTQRSYDTGVNQLEDRLNKGNLFYSGARGTKLGEAATAFQGANYANQQRFRGSLETVQNALASALTSARDTEAQAQTDAYSRALAAALAGGYAGVAA